MLRRIAISLLILVALAFIVVPFGVGFIVERFYPDSINQLNRAWSGGEVRFERMNRGWFSSTAEGVLLAQGQPPMPWLDVIAHGPIPWGAEDKTPAWLAGRMTLPEPSAQLSGHIDYRANLDASLKAQLNLERSGNSASGFRSGPLSLAALMPADGSSFEFELQSQLLNEPALPLKEVAGTEAQGVFNRLDSGFWIGELSAQIERVDLTDHWISQLQDLNFELSTAADSGLATIEAALHAGAVSSSEVNYESATGRLNMSNLEELAVGRLLKQLGRGGDADARSAAFLGELIAQAPVLVSTRPRLIISESSVDTNYGSASGSVDLTLVDPDPRLLTEPIYLLAYLSGKIQVELPGLLARHWIRQRVLARAPEIAGSSEIVEAAVSDGYDELISDGTFVQRGRTLSSIIEFRDGGAIVNGKAIPLPRPPQP